MTALRTVPLQYAEKRAPQGVAPVKAQIEVHPQLFTVYGEIGWFVADVSQIYSTLAKRGSAHLKAI